MAGHYADALVGKTIRAVRSLSDTEVVNLLWFQTDVPTCVIEFTDNTYALVAADSALSGAGFLSMGEYQLTAVISQGS
jgi:hypothetical protein